MYEYRLLIPKERVGVLVGDKGKIKRLIEQQTSTSLEIEQEEVSIKSEDSYKAWICQQIVKAIGRGFNPREALKLSNENFVFELIDIMDFARSKNDKYRLRGRVIGEDGKNRLHIEKTTKTKITVFGKTIGVIGKAEDVQITVEAIKMILEGSQIKTAHKFIERELKKRVRKELM